MLYSLSVVGGCGVGHYFVFVSLLMVYCFLGLFFICSFEIVNLSLSAAPPM